MKKFLLPFLGGTILSLSSILSTSNSVITNKMITQQNQTFSNNSYQSTNEQATKITTKELQEVKQLSTMWNNNQINQTLQQVLQYQNGILKLDQKRLNKQNLPQAISNRLNLSLSYLNNAIQAKYVKISVVNNQVKFTIKVNLFQQSQINNY